MGLKEERKRLDAKRGKLQRPREKESCRSQCFYSTQLAKKHAKNDTVIMKGSLSNGEETEQKEVVDGGGVCILVFIIPLPKHRWWAFLGITISSPTGSASHWGSPISFLPVPPDKRKRKKNTKERTQK